MAEAAQVKPMTEAEAKRAHMKAVAKFFAMKLEKQK